MKVQRAGRAAPRTAPDPDAARCGQPDLPAAGSDARRPDAQGPPDRGLLDPGLHAEDGVGTVSSVFAVLAFLVFLAIVVQTALYMLTASMVQTAALDGATHGAGAARAASVPAARDRAEAVLGGLADGAAVTGSVRSDGSGEVLQVTVTVPGPSFLARGIGVRRIQRSAEARIEQ